MIFGLCHFVNTGKVQELLLESWSVTQSRSTEGARLDTLRAESRFQQRTCELRFCLTSEHTMFPKEHF